MTLLLRKQNAQDRIEGREPFGWKNTDYAVLDNETRIGRMYLEQLPAVVLVSAGNGRATTEPRHCRHLGRSQGRHCRRQGGRQQEIRIGAVDCDMCGRFTQRYTWREIHDLYDLTGAARNLQAHYNIAPTDTVEVVRSTEGGANELVPMRWGLIPYWWKKPVKQLPATFNARAESVATKPMFRDAFKRQRCIIPASGYYEWIKMLDGKQPYFISAADGGTLSFAGLWDRWKNPETGEPLASCTIIVTDANALTRTIHDRMPVLLDKADFGAWLSGAAGTELLRPAAEDRVRMWPVSRRVNKTGSGDDDPTLVDEVAT